MADNENSLSKLRPLPDDILAMAETETACHYCGISYLLLSKYEKMETHVKDMEAEMRYLKKYVDERPGMVSRLESLLQLQKHSAVTIGDLEKQLGETRRESEWNVKDLKVMKDKNSELSESLNAERTKLSRVKDQASLSQSEIRIQMDDIKLKLSKMRDSLIDETFLKNSARQMEWDILKQETLRNLTQVHQKKLRESKEILEKDHKAQLSIKQKEQEELLQIIEDQTEQILNWHQEKRKLEDDIYNSKNGQKLLLEQAHQRSAILESELNEAKAQTQTLKLQNESLELRIKEYEATLIEKEALSVKGFEALQEDIREKDNQIKELTDTLNSERKSVEATRSLATQAGLGLAKKDETIYQLEKSVKQLNQDLKVLEQERQQTIDAHQSRIKQLQDTFLVQIKEAGRLEAEKAEAQVKRIMTAEKDAAIKEWTRQLREEFSTQEAKFKEDLKQAKNQFEEAKRHQVTQETAWQMKCNLLIEQYKKTQASNSADFEHYQARIRGLEEEITVLKHQAAPAAEAPNSFSSEEVEELKSLLAKKTAEVSFLKDTVRLECEERIQLVTQLASLTKNPGSGGISGRGSGGTLASTSTPNLKALSASPLPPKGPSTQTPLDGDERAFVERMQAATAKKDRKLARSSSLKKLQKYSS